MIENTYIALIGDLVASRDQPDRAAEQKWLISAIAATRERVLWAAPLTLTAGDEVQGLIRAEDGEMALQAMTFLSEALIDTSGEARTAAGRRIRFGLGKGSLATAPADPERLAETSPAMLDGPCFHRARAALDRARAGGRWACVSGFSSELDDTDGKTLDALLALMGHIQASWTATQVKYIRGWRQELVRRIDESFHRRQAGASPRVFMQSITDELIKQHERGSRSTLAESMGRSPSVITQAFKSAAFEEVLAAEEAVRLILRRCGKNRGQGERA